MCVLLEAGGPGVIASVMPKPTGRWVFVISTGYNCSGCWDNKCGHTVCSECGGHGHTAQEHAALAKQIQEESK